MLTLEKNESKMATIAMTLSLEMHRFFGSFKIFFDRVADDDAADTYQIRAFHPFLAARL